MELYKRFKSTYPPAVRLSLRSFEGLKPFFVRKLKERYTCCCVYHVQMIYFKEVFNQMRQKKFEHHGKCHICTCSICCGRGHSGECSASHAVFQHISVLWESIMCSKFADSEYHAKKFLFGHCPRCGVSKLTLCPDEIASDSRELTVKVFKDMETGQVDATGSEKKQKDLVVERIQSAAFIHLFSDNLKRFIQHNFLFRWQPNSLKIACL